MPHAGDLIYLTASLVSYKQLQTAFEQKLLAEAFATQPSMLAFSELQHT